MFNGWLQFDGTEIANADRVAQYVRNLAPRIDFDEMWGSEDVLGGVLGDKKYVSPAVDPAPWYSEHRPASAKFLGFYPLSIEGVEDSSREVTITELVRDGGVASLPRRRTREFRVRGNLMAVDDEGLDAGAQWLAGALTSNGSEGSSCAGAIFCYMAFLPPFCNYDDPEYYPLVPANDQSSGGALGNWLLYGDATQAASSGPLRVNMPCDGDGAQYHLSGLIPGQPYRLQLDMTSMFAMSVSISGHDEMTAVRDNLYLDRGRTPWIIDFIAHDPNEVVRVTSAVGDCTAATASIYGIKVSRLPQLQTKALPRFSPTSYQEPASWAWVDTVTIDHGASLSTGVEELELSWINTTGATIPVAAGDGPRRLIRGLEVGRGYQIYMRLDWDDDIVPTLDVVGGLSEAIVDLGGGWYRVDFTAAAPQHYIILTSSAGFTVPAGESRSFRLKYLRVDRNIRNLMIQPVDQSQPALRSLHGVTLLEGPRKIDDYTMDVGAMRQVEFTMIATRPWTFSELVDVHLSPDATAYLVSTGECVNGYPVRSNGFTNPFFRNSVTSGGIGVYSAYSANQGSLAVVPGVEAAQNALEISPSGSSSYITVPFDSASFVEGHTYTIAATLMMATAQAGAIGADARAITVTDAAGTVRSAQGANVAGNQRIWVTFTYSGGMTSIRLHNGSDTTDVAWTALMFEEGGIAGAPFDGDSTDASWDGVADESTSSWQKSSPTLIRDPDCAVIPTAPQPPTITPDCVRTVDEWRRYWTEVPAYLTGGWNDAIPVVRLTTRSSELRDVRVRFYPNPNRQPLVDVDDCSYCGEFYISYIPPFTEFIVDGINELAVADVQGTGRQNVMHLVSDFDYGPIRWPQMSCDTPYFVTFDIAPDEVQTVDVRVAVARKE